MNMIVRLHHKFFQIITPFVLNTQYLSKIHILTISYAKVWHPYIDNLLDDQIKIFKYLKSQQIIYLKVQLTATGVLQFYTEDSVYMVPCGKLSNESLSENYKNWLLIKASVYSNLVDYKLKNMSSKDLLYYSMSRLLPISNEQEARNYIITCLKSEDRKYLVDYINLSNANDKLKKHCQLDFSNIIDKIKDRQLISSIGPLHGDLTEQNMLKTHDEKVVIIDLDRFVFNGVQFIDELHFYIESMSKKEGTPWLQILIKILNTKDNKVWKDEEIIGYFLFRLDAEIRDDIKPTKNYLKHVYSAAEKISKYYQIKVNQL